MKELKDYIHLYIGCEVLAKDPSLEDDHEPVRGILTGIHGEYGPEVAFFDTPHHTRESPEYPGEATLILRPLDSMTKEEAEEIGWWFEPDEMIIQFRNCPNQDLPWVLKKGFDLFDLRSDGLCVYENEIAK